jgi:hypothetical protein
MTTASRRRRQYDKEMQEKFYVYNQELEEARRLASASATSQTSTNRHKHTSFTQTQDTTGSRLSARVEFFEASASASTGHQVLPEYEPQSFDDSNFNIMDGAHDTYSEDTNIEHIRKRKRTAGVSTSALNICICEFILCRIIHLHHGFPNETHLSWRC